MHWAIEKAEEFCLKLENRIVWKKGIQGKYHTIAKTKKSSFGGHVVNFFVNRCAVIHPGFVIPFIEHSQSRFLRALRFLEW